MSNLDKNPTSKNLNFRPGPDGLIRVRYLYVGGHTWEHTFDERNERWWRKAADEARSWADAFAPFVEFLPLT